MNRNAPLAALALSAAACLAGLPAQAPAPEKDPYLAFEYDYKHNFGVSVLKNPAGKPVKKQLTFDTHGQTNSTVVRLDGQDLEFGTGGGKFLEEGRSHQNPSKAVWAVGKVEVAQVLKVEPGKTGKLDTILVRYVLENKDAKPHKVGLRVMIDTAIGAPDNDGVPFRYAGGKELVTTFKDFRGGAVPDWVEALENPDEKDPGTILVLTLKAGGGLEAPGRASITLWLRAHKGVWDLPLQAFSTPGKGRGDSCLVLYWEEAELGPGQKRELGYRYGTQEKPTAADPPRKSVLPPFTPPPPSCCKGPVSVQHAQCALKAALGIVRAEPLMDTDRDGRVTERDAAELLRECVSQVRGNP
jgi:hypothetical protein